MQLKTLGTVFAACTGLGSTAVLALAPDYKIIAWVILIGSILWLLGALVLFVRAHFRLRLPWERRPEGGAANETPAVPSASVATQQRRRYTAYDLQKRQQALDEFSNFIVGPTTTLLERGLKLMRDCNNSVFSMGEFYHHLDEYRGLIHNTEQDVSQLMMKHHIYSDHAR